MKLWWSHFALVAIATAAVQALTAPSPQDFQFVQGGLASIILGHIQNAINCDGCLLALHTLKRLATLGDSIFISALTEACTLSKAEDPDVCHGTVASEGPILAQVLKKLNVGSETSHILCATLLGLCHNPAVTPKAIAFPQPKPKTSRPPPSGKTPIQVVHISDTHVDLSYELGASYNCTKPICCRPYTSAEAPGNNAYPAGPYGEHTCDAPLTLEQSMFAAIESLSPEAAFTIFTGDVVAHDVWLVNRAEVEADLNTTFGEAAGLKLLYPTIGNHDMAPVNAFPPSSITASLTAQWVYDIMSADWRTWIGPSAAQFVQDFGAYSVKYPGGNLRIISFNSIFYYTLNLWMYQDPMEDDPSGQFAWLISELQFAETASERVWLIAHVPSGSGDFFHSYSNTFNQIISRYDATIAALFYGHTHMDQFEVTYANYTNPTFDTAVAMSYIAPSMTPTSGSPAFRVYSIDPETFAVLDFTQYFANISSPTYQSRPVWEKYYSAKATYGSLLSPPVTDPAAELTPAFWHNVTQLFKTDDAVFQAYYSRKSRGYNGSGCTGPCKSAEICQLRAAESQYNCAKVRRGAHFSKRGAQPGHSDECEGGRIREIFAAMTNEKGKFVEQ